MAGNKKQNSPFIRQQHCQCAKLPLPLHTARTQCIAPKSLMLRNIKGEKESCGTRAAVEPQTPESPDSYVNDWLALLPCSAGVTSAWRLRVLRCFPPLHWYNGLQCVIGRLDCELLGTDHFLAHADYIVPNNIQYTCIE